MESSEAGAAAAHLEGARGVGGVQHRDAARVHVLLARVVQLPHGVPHVGVRFRVVLGEEFLEVVVQIREGLLRAALGG